MSEKVNRISSEGKGICSLLGRAVNKEREAALFEIGYVLQEKALNSLTLPEGSSFSAIKDHFR